MRLNFPAFIVKFFYRKTIILIFVFACIFIKNISAQEKNFSPAIEDETLLQSLSAKFEKNYQAEITALPSQYKKDLIELYKERWAYVKEKFDSKEIYTSVPAQQYLNALVAEIVKVNPLLQNKDFSCFFSRSGIPNASYIGEGIILFNMGLFSKLENESQVVFVLCHELSHFYLKHNENSLTKYVVTLNSDEVQQKLHSIKKSEYGKRKELEKLLTGLAFDTRRHGRNHEGEADSMALEFMRNSRFNINESLRTLALLDSIDTDTLDINRTLQKVFNSKEYPFQKKWIAREDGLLGGYASLQKDQTLIDSLKTHPDCKFRIIKLEPLVKKYFNGLSPKNIIDEAKFNEFKNTFSYETVEYAFLSGAYTQSLHNTIELLQTQPSNPYLITQVGKIFNGLYDAQKNHTLGKIIDLPSPYFDDNYNLLLQFIQNLYLQNIILINYHFLKQYEAALSYYQPFKENFNKSLQLAQQ